MSEAESRSMKMLLQRMPIKGFILTFVSWAILFFICVIIGATGPTVYSYNYTDAWLCSDPNQATFDANTCQGVDLSKAGTSIALTIGVERLNQQLNLVATIGNRVPTLGTFTKDISIYVNVYARNSEDEFWVTLSEGAKNRSVYCMEGSSTCWNLTLAEVQYLDYKYYQFSVSFDTRSNIVDFMGNVYFTLSRTNDSYSLYELWFRFIFLIITFVVIVIFAARLRRFAWSYWTFEQKWTLILLFGLMLYNNPFYPGEILVSGWFPIFINRLLYTSFLMLLLYYWLVTLDGIRTEPQRITFKTFYLPKLVLMVLAWICVITVFTWSSLYKKDDPSYSAVDEIPGFIFFEVMLLIFLVIYIFWVVYIVCRGCSDMRVIPALGPRLKFFAVFTLVVLGIAVGGLIFGFLNDSNNAAQFLSYLGLFNLYIYVNAFLYLPAGMSSEASYSQNMAQPEHTEVVRLEEEDAPPKDDDHN